MKELLIFIVIVAIVAGLYSIPKHRLDFNYSNSQLKIDTLEARLKEQTETVIMLNNYINWKACIDGSDSTDTDCQKCDSLYNPDGEFVY